MIKKLGLLVAGAMLTTSAQAVPITGSLSLQGGFDGGGLPSAPSSSVVSLLTSINVQNAANVYTPLSGTTDFVGTTSALAFDILPPALPTTFFTTDGGFTFTVASFVKTASQALSCSGGGVLCSDEIDFFFTGVVSRPGFDATPFVGVWTGNGSCISASANNVCSESVSGSWSASIVARVPEPGILALLGLGLAGLGFARRRKVH